MKPQAPDLDSCLKAPSVFILRTSGGGGDQHWDRVNLPLGRVRANPFISTSKFISKISILYPPRNSPYPTGNLIQLLINTNTVLSLLAWTECVTGEDTLSKLACCLNASLEKMNWSRLNVCLLAGPQRCHAPLRYRRSPVGRGGAACGITRETATTRC
jgi:hypothetical protein